jgi:hypothetical protein
MNGSRHLDETGTLPLAAMSPVAELGQDDTSEIGGKAPRDTRASAAHNAAVHMRLPSRQPWALAERDRSYVDAVRDRASEDVLSRCSLHILAISFIRTAEAT